MSRLRALWGAIQGEALFQYFHLVTRTARFHVEGGEQLERAEASGLPLLWAFWHQQVMLAAHYIYRQDDPARYSNLIVGDDRGFALAHAGRRLGLHAAVKVDMQGNPVVAGRAVLEVVKAMKRGYRSMIAPDGPDGPAFTPKAGMAFVAQKAEALILPMGAYCRPAWKLRRWDEYLVTLPFSDFFYVFGQPIQAMRREDSQSLTDRVAAALSAARQRAQHLSRQVDGRGHHRPDSQDAP